MFYLVKRYYINTIPIYIYIYEIKGPVNHRLQDGGDFFKCTGFTFWAHASKPFVGSWFLRKIVNGRCNVPQIFYLSSYRSLSHVPSQNGCQLVRTYVFLVVFALVAKRIDQFEIR